MDKGAVVLVDSNLLWRRRSVEALSASGYETHEFADSSQAIEYLTEHEKGVVVIDYNWLKTNQAQWAKFLKAKIWKGKIVFLLGSPSPSLARDCFKLGKNIAVGSTYGTVGEMANRAERRKAVQQAYRLAHAKSEDCAMPKPIKPASQVPVQSSQHKPPFYETNLFWGSVGVFGLFVSVVLTVIAAMLHDIRWLLIPAGMFGIISVTCFRKVFQWSYWFVAFGTVVVVAFLIDVNIFVKPSVLSEKYV